MAAAPDLSQIPPSDIPDALQDGIAKLSAPLKQLLMMKSVPYLIQHRLGSENYVTVEDLADRWDSAQVARQQGPRELGFEADHNGFTAASSGFAAMKLFQVVRAAKEMIQTHPSVLATPGPGPSRPLSLTEVLCERPQLEKEFSAKWGIPKPQYRDQGSDALLRRQYKFCSKGEIGFIHSKYIISALPEEGERPIKTRKKITVDGWEKEEEEEERAAPTTRRQLEREAYSWLRYVPNRLRQRVLPTVAQGAFNPGPVLVLLYAGKDDPLSLDSCLHAHYPRLSPYVVAFDTRRSPQPLGHDLLTDQPYGKLCQAAIEGRVRLVCGGPNCRTWSILRWFPKPNAPLPVRGRAEDLVWGLPTLTDQEQEEVDGEPTHPPPDVFDNIDEAELLSAGCFLFGTSQRPNRV